MANNYGISDAELNLIKQQAQRRVAMRQEFQKQKTNPWKNAGQSGHVFDPAVQRFMSMKVTQLEFFQANKRTGMFGVCAIIIPMSVYGYAVWTRRQDREAKIRSGELKYKDRLFKFC